MTFPTRTELFQTGVGVVVQRGLLRPPGERLTREAAETPGTDLNIVTATASFMADDVARASAGRMAALYLFSAEGDDLDRLVADRYSGEVVRKQASPSVTYCQFVRTGGPLSAVDMGVGFKVRAGGVEFALTAPLSFPAGATKAFGPGLVQAVTPGVAGNVTAGAINAFVDQPPDQYITVTNAEPASGGNEKEGDASLRSRAVYFYVTARRGTVPAIEIGALKIGGVAYATAIEEVDGNGDPTGRISLYVSDSSGQGNLALAAATKLGLREYRAAGVPVDCFACSPYFQDITYHLAFEAGVDPTAAFAQVQLATVVAVNSLKPKQTLQRSLLASVARSVPGVIVNEDAIMVPAGDIVPVGNQIIRTSAGRVTNSI